MEDSFKATGLECHYDKFRSRRGDYAPRIISLSALFLSVLLYRTSPLFFYGSFVFFLIMLLFEIMGRSPLGLFQWRYASRNVWARIDPFDRIDRTLVVMAPLDHPLPPLRAKTPGTNGSRLPSLLLVTLNIALGMWLTLMTGAHLLYVSSEIQRFFWYIALAVSTLDLAAAAVLIVRRALGRKKGVSENESSQLATLLLLGERFSRRRPARTRLWLVAVGSDSAGGIGVKRFVSAHRRELKGALFLFLDGMGRDRPLTYRKAGVLFPFRSHRSTLKLMESINQRYPHYRLQMEGAYPSRGGFYRLLSSGRHAVILSSRFDKERSREEVSRDRVNPTFLRENTDFVAHIVEEVDREARSRSR